MSEPAALASRIDAIEDQVAAFGALVRVLATSRHRERPPRRHSPAPLQQPRRNSPQPPPQPDGYLFPADLPTIIVPGPPKSSTTYLWDCLFNAFHPRVVCDSKHANRWSDAACASQRFVLAPLISSADRPRCLAPWKESYFWLRWGEPGFASHDAQKPTVRHFLGPRFPLSRWEGGAKACFNHPESGRVAFVHHGALEDVCLADAPPCAAAREYAKPLPEECAQTCRPCEGMDAAVRGAAGAGACSAALRPYRCSSPQCREGYVPKWLRQRNYSAQYARAYAVSALPHRAALRAANVTADRVAVLEGQPRLWGSRVSGARLAALAALSSRGHAALRFVVGLRDPFELMFSLWSFLYTLGRMPGRVEPTVGRALAHVRGCNATLFAAPARVLRTPEAELAEYHYCVREGKAAERANSFLVHDSLYALNFLAWLPHFRGDQFLFVRNEALPRDAAQATALQRALATFLGLPPPAADRGKLCLNANFVTNKGKVVRAHNATIAEVKGTLAASKEGREVKAFFDAHHALLPELVRREGASVYPETYV